MFIRLQEEIMKNSDDWSLFAWVESEECHPVFVRNPHGLLTSSPQNFADSGGIKFLGRSAQSDAFAVTNRGLLIELFLVPYYEVNGNYYTSLDCCIDGVSRPKPSDTSEMVLGARSALDELSENTIYARARRETLYIIGWSKNQWRVQSHTRSIASRCYNSSKHSNRREGQLFRIIRHFTKDIPIDPRRIFPSTQWKFQTKLFHKSVEDEKCGAAQWKPFQDHCTMILDAVMQDHPGSISYLLFQALRLTRNMLYNGYQMTRGDTSESKADFMSHRQTFIIKLDVVLVETFWILVFVINIYAEKIFRPR